ncbi:MAG: hypothetical protein CME61_06545 [Halobacteriovoraceae bacterium]|nr:hypothetical protein [Halobacteriovoraceae bacterium]|tara:strand:- start:885 stop:1070 length:186 start_codon:yes stop_codon:yes gene_type:complete
MAKKNYKKTYDYECSLTGEKYTLTEKSKNPEELISVQAWYEMNPDKDDRTELEKKKRGIDS